MSNIMLSKTDFNIVSEDEGKLPDFLGNYIRSAVSYGIFRKFCINEAKNKDCKTCRYRNHCFYVALFDSYYQNPVGTQLVLLHPHKEYIKKDEPFTFSIILYGDIWRLHHLFFSLKKRKIRIKDKHFTLKEISSTEIDINKLILRQNSYNLARVSFKRVCAKWKNQFIREIEKDALREIVGRRFRVLSKIYNEEIPAPIIESIEIKSQRPYELIRRKRGEYQKFPVFDVDFTVSGERLEHLIWLEYVGIGKALTFGLGNVKVDYFN